MLKIWSVNMNIYVGYYYTVFPDVENVRARENDFWVRFKFDILHGRCVAIDLVHTQYARSEGVGSNAVHSTQSRQSKNGLLCVLYQWSLFEKLSLPAYLLWVDTWGEDFWEIMTF